MVRVLVALALVFSMVPMAELVEQAVHLVEHGVGVDDHDLGHHDDPADEHGCTELLHLCGAGHGAATLSATAIMSPRPTSLSTALTWRAASWSDSAARPPPHRPPDRLTRIRVPG